MEAFERRVPQVLWRHAKGLGYDRIEDERRQEWLRERFFLPGGWPECPTIACIESLSRVRKAVWSTLQDVSVLNVNAVARGRPAVREKKERLLYHVIHAHYEKPILPEWQWPLIRLAMSDAIFPSECLWLLGREGVLPLVFARLYGIELAVYCAREEGLAEELIDRACEWIRDESDRGTSGRAMRTKLIRMFPEDSGAALVFFAAVDGTPYRAVRLTLGQAARCLKKPTREMQLRFAEALKPVIMERSY